MFDAVFVVVVVVAEKVGLMIFVVLAPVGVVCLQALFCGEKESIKVYNAKNKMLNLSYIYKPS